MRGDAVSGKAEQCTARFTLVVRIRSAGQGRVMLDKARFYVRGSFLDVFKKIVAPRRALLPH